MTRYVSPVRRIGAVLVLIAWGLLLAVPSTASPPFAFFAASNIVERFERDSETRLTGPWLSDMSGCCVMPSTGELLVIQNRRSNLSPFIPGIQVYALDGSYTGRSIDLTGFVDTEGICAYRPESNLFAVVEEGVTDITIVTITAATTNITKASGTTIHMGLHLLDSNKGIEGVTYDSRRDCFYLVQEQSDMAVYVVSNYLGAVTVEPLFDAETVFASYCTDLSEVAYNACSDRLFVLSDEGAKVMECTRNGQVVATFPVALGQAEGITFSPLQPEIYVVGEPNYYQRYSLQPLATSLDEGQEYVAEVQLSHPHSLTSSVDFRVASATALSGVDYVADPDGGTITFSPGQTSALIRVVLLTDDETEGSETLLIELEDSSDVDLGIDRARECTIVDVLPLTIVPNTGWAATGFENGPFAPSNMVYTLTNTTDSALEWTAECAAPWVSLSTTNGTLSGREMTNVNAVLVGAEAMTPGTNEDVIVFSEVGRGANQSRPVALVVLERVLDHFMWDAVAFTQYVDEAFAATITARDATGQTLSAFTGTVSIAALTGEVTTVEGSMLEGVTHNSSEFASYPSRGLRFSPARDLNVTHVLHYWGEKVTIWTDAGDEVASKNVTSSNGQWVETALTFPVTLTGGAIYRIAAYRRFYRSIPRKASTLPRAFADGEILSSCSGTGDVFPASEYTNVTELVDFRYSDTEGRFFTVEPTNSPPFVDGAWSGSLTVHERATNLFVRAYTEGYFADSNPFDVVDPPKELVVVSPHGGSQPGCGTNRIAPGTFVVCAVTNSPAAGGAGTRYVCTGGVVVGNDYAEVNPTNVTLRLTNDATLTWLWQTNYWLDVGTSGSGVLSSADSWCAIGSDTTVTAVASDYWHFGGWEGDTGDCDQVEASITVPMTRPRSITALFRENLTTNATPEWWLAAHGLTNRGWEIEALDDQDDDKMATWQEWHADTDPRNSASLLKVTGISPTNGGWVVDWQGGTQSWQLVERRNTLLSTGEIWRAIVTNPPPTPVGASIFDSGSTNRTTFYRIRAGRD